MDKNSLSKEAYEYFKNKDYKNARIKYISLLKNYADELDDNYRTNRNSLNNLIVSTYNLLLNNPSSNSEYTTEIFKYLEEYLDIAKSDTEQKLKQWSDNILLDIFESIIDVILIKYSDITSGEKENLIRDDVESYFNKFISIFTPVLKKELFFDVFLKKIYAERRNFGRKGSANQNIKNVKILASVFIEILIPFKDEDFVKNNLANIYIILADLAYYNQEYNQNKKEMESIKLLETSLSYKETMFAKSRIKQLDDINFAERRISLFRHDMVSKMSTYKEDLKSLLSNNKSEDEKRAIVFGNISRINYLLSLYGLVNRKRPFYEFYYIKNIIDEFDKSITKQLNIKSDFKTKMEIDIDYFRIIIENLLKNSLDAYKRNQINIIEDRMIFIEINLQKNFIKLRDFAGGVKENFLVNNRLFEAHTSEKEVAQNHGLGLSLVKDAVEVLGGVITVENYKENNKKGVEFKIENIFLKEEEL